MTSRRQFMQNVALATLPALSFPMFANATWTAGGGVHLPNSQLALDFLRALRSAEPSLAKAFFGYFCPGVDASSLVVQTSGHNLLIQSSRPISGLTKAFGFFSEESRIAGLQNVKSVLICGQRCPEWLHMAISNRELAPAQHGKKVSLHVEQNMPQHLLLARREQRRLLRQSGVEVNIVEVNHHKFWDHWTDHELCIVNWATGRSNLANRILITSSQSPWHISSPEIPAGSARMFSLA